MSRKVVAALCLLVLLAFSVAPATAQEVEIRPDTALESFLSERANVTVDLPGLGYEWSDTAVSGTAEVGRLSVNASKVIYYFVHWGPIEREEIAEAYARERIPEVWPGEGLEVLSLSDTVVAGHPAWFAEVKPKRDFYRAFFVIWNCPDSKRQFIADMNYNIRVKTPRSELEAELSTTFHTLACHPGAETEQLPSHVVPYSNPRFEVSFHHPLDWYVMESPYGVPHPAYSGTRDKSIGSLLAHIQDVTTDITFVWDTLPRTPPEDADYMGGSVSRYRDAITIARSVAYVDSFTYDAAETFRVGDRTAFKLFGDVKRKVPEKPDPGFVATARAMVLIVDDDASKRRFAAVIVIDDYEMDGAMHRPVRDIFDQWGVSLARGMAL